MLFLRVMLLIADLGTCDNTAVTGPFFQAKICFNITLLIYKLRLLHLDTDIFVCILVTKALIKLSRCEAKNCCVPSFGS